MNERGPAAGGETPTEKRPSPACRRGAARGIPTYRPGGSATPATAQQSSAAQLESPRRGAPVRDAAGRARALEKHRGSA
eukprot:8135413-Pyramimonas_sp.AAC.1